MFNNEMLLINSNRETEQIFFLTIGRGYIGSYEYIYMVIQATTLIIFMVILHQEHFLTQ